MQNGKLGHREKNDTRTLICKVRNAAGAENTAEDQVAPFQIKNKNAGVGDPNDQALLRDLFPRDPFFRT